MSDKLRVAIKERHADWKEKQVEKTVRALLLASIKFGMLKQDPDRVITFSMEDAMATDGYTGPYIMYTVARISSILRKATMKPAKTFTKVHCAGKLCSIKTRLV